MAKSAEHPTTAKLRAFHKLGKKTLNEQRKRTPRGKSRYGIVGPILEGLPHAESYLHCARRFAKEYSAGNELESICRLGQRSGKPLGPSHVMQLLSVEDQDARDELAKQCAKEGWSVIRLRHELAKTREKKPFGGRQIRMATDPELAVVELQFMAERWIRWISATKTPRRNNGASVYGRLPKQVRKALSAIEANLATLIPTPVEAPVTRQKSIATKSHRCGKRAASSERDRGRVTSKRV